MNLLDTFIETTPACWRSVIQLYLNLDSLEGLSCFLEKERLSKVSIYPEENLVFNALKVTPYNSVKVVIVGQDPYHGEGQAHGLSFSVPDGVKIPPSLRNIYKELEKDIGIPPSISGNLTSWGKEGVLLLNSTLTVRSGAPKSHHAKGWELFTDAVIKSLCERENPVIFILWGKLAQKKCECVFVEYPDLKPYLLLAAHPSPYSANRGFFESYHFSKANALLVKLGEKPINWNL